MKSRGGRVGKGVVCPGKSGTSDHHLMEGQDGYETIYSQFNLNSFSIKCFKKPLDDFNISCQKFGKRYANLYQFSFRKHYYFDILNAQFLAR